MKTFILCTILWGCSVAACFSQDSWNVNLVGYYDTPGGVGGVAVAGNYAYIADGEAGFRVINISNPATPTEIGFCDTPGFAYGLVIEGSHAYIADEECGLRVIDISNPAAPFEIGSYDTPGTAWGVAVVGEYAFLADGNCDGLLVFNISNSALPTLVGSFCPPGYPYGVAVVGNYAFVAASNRGLRVIDIRSPTSPMEVGSYDTPGWAYHVAVAGNKAYVTDDVCGLRVIDITIPTAPTEVGYYDTPMTAVGVAVAGDYAYVADSHGGLRVIDISNPSTPTETGFYDTPGDAQCVAVVGNYAYVADFNSGLGIYDCSRATGNILPVELLSFEAIPGDRQVSLQWTTASETDNAHFDIERDGTIMSRVQATNSSTRNSYIWSESNLVNGREYTYSLISVSTSGEREIIGTASATPTTNTATITEYALHQNYPNPFNPETNISFDLVEAGEVTLTVYNSTGQTVATLVNGEMNSGRHSVTFDASNLPSGLYIYRLNATDFTAVKKMVLMK
jgi:hypothetical protein